MSAALFTFLAATRFAWQYIHQHNPGPLHLSCALEIPGCLSSIPTQLTTRPLQQTETGLPPNWEVRHSNSKNLPYYFNAAEKSSRWEPPTGTDTEKLKIYMAKYHSPNAGAEGASNQPGKIRAAHLLVKHRGSRRPMSWREVSFGFLLHTLRACTLGMFGAPAWQKEEQGRKKRGRITSAAHLTGLKWASQLTL